MTIELMFITNDPDVAIIAERNGVERIWVDLETLGKEERQKNMNTVKSKHTVQDVEKLSQVLTTSELMVRVNPWNVNSVDEIEQVIAAGAQRIMLPMWKSVHEVQCFLDTVDRRVATTLLLETSEAADCLDSVLELPNVDEIHIGLNDLHLSRGLTFMFELLSDGTVEKLCHKIKCKGLQFGFGGIARIGEGMLPAEKIVCEHYRLGSTRAILSRSFCNTDEVKDLDTINSLFCENMKKLREYEDSLQYADENFFLENQKEVAICVERVVKTIKDRRKNG